MLKNSRFLRFIGLGLVVELVVIAAIVVSISTPTSPSLSDALPTQMVLPVASTPLPDGQVASGESTQPIEVASVPTTTVEEILAAAPVAVEPAERSNRAFDGLQGVEPNRGGAQPIIPPTPLQQEPVPNQVVIQFKPDAKAADINAYVASIGGTVNQQIDALNTVVVNLPAAQASQPLPSAAQVVNSEPDYFVSAQVSLPPSDPYYTQQWALPVIGATTAWNALPSNAPQVKVAIIDSGICADHPDLQGRILAGWDFVDNDATPQDDYGHGCDIAGIIAANVDDGVGIAGVAPNAMLLPYRILNAQGIGTYSNVAAAIVRAVDDGAQVINLSVGGTNPSTILETAINYAAAKHVTVVAAAGNTGSNVLYPAAYDSVVAVGSVDQSLTRSSFSAYLPQLDTLAPGRDILTTGHNQDYVTVSGTSFAAAQVSGIVALNLGAGYPVVFNGSVLTFGAQDVVSKPPAQVVIQPATSDDGEVTPLAVIGSDSRVRVNPTTVTPNSTIVQIEFSSGGSGYICSGALISSVYVLTAGHCVYDEGVYATSFFVIPAKNGPGFNSNDEPYGYRTATIAYVPPTWVSTNTAGCGFSCANLDYDWALLQISSPFAGVTPTFAISSYQDSFLINSVGTYTNAGYPGDKCVYIGGAVDYCPSFINGYPSGNVVSGGLGVTQWTASGSIVGSLLTPYKIATQIDTYGGQSGSPLWFTDAYSRNIIVGVLSHSYGPPDYCTNTPQAQCSPQTFENYFRRTTNDMLQVLNNLGVPYIDPNACYTVNINTNGAGSGITDVPPSKLGCSAGKYAGGEKIELSAIATPGSLFNGWSATTGWSAPANSINTTFTVSGIATITANFVVQPAPAGGSILPAGYYDDRDARISYTSKWTLFNSTGPSAGTLTVVSTKNEIAQFAFTGSGVVIYRRTGSGRGSMEICIDTTCQTVSAYSATGIWAVPIIINTSNTTHNVRIRSLLPNTIDVDAIQVLSPTNALGVGTYQETETNLTYIGQWTQSTNANMLGGARKFTNDQNARVSFDVTNSVGRVVIYRTVYQAGVYGSMQVYVDGVLTPPAIANNTSATMQYGVPFTFIVSPGDHTIELRNVGTTYSDIDQIILLPPPTPLDVGTYQETQPDLVYVGNWTQNTNANALGGSRKFTNDANGRVSFNTTSNVGRVTIYRTLYQTGVYGSLQVYVDGVLTPPAIANYPSATMLFGQPFTFLLPAGAHTIELRNVGTTYSDIDQIVLEVPPTPLGVGTYQETQPDLVYIGNWTQNTNANALGGSRKFTNDANGRVSFKTTSAVGRVTIYRTLYQAGVYGSLQVYVDGVLTPPAIANYPSANLLFGQPFTFILPAGAHTIELRNVGTTYSDIDQIVLEVPPTPLGIGTYQENQADVIYIGNWTQNTNANALGGARKFTNDANGRVTFNTTSAVGRVTIYRTIYQTGVYGSLQVYVDGVLTPPAIANNPSATFLFGQPFTFFLPTGAHTVELRNVGTTYSDIDQIVLEAPLGKLGTGTYQETDANLIYNGIWTQNSNGTPLGGSRKVTNDANGRVTFDINSSVGRVVIYRTLYQAGVYGSMQVYVDGVLTPPAIANYPSATLLFGQPFTLIVTPGNHRIELRNVGTTYSDIDQITLLAPPTSLGVGTYQETDANLIYLGNWTQNTNGTPLGGSRKVTNDANGRVTFNINNTVGRVTIYRTIYQTGVYGSLQVYIDGVLNVRVANDTSSTLLFGQPFTFTVTPGDHTIELRNMGSLYSDLDQITLQAATAPLALGTHQETDVDLTYTGVWVPNTNANALGGSRKFTNDANGRVTFNIDNTVGRVTIYRTIYQPGVYGSLQVYIDGLLTPPAIANNTSSTFLFGRPFVINVTPGNHRIELRNVGTTYSDLDQILLEAPGSLSQPIITPTATPMDVPTATITATMTSTLTATLETPEVTATATSTETATIEVTATTLAPTDVPTNTAIPTDIPTSTPLPTNTAVPTDIPTSTPLPTDVPTSTPVPTDTPTEVPAGG